MEAWSENVEDLKGRGELYWEGGSWTVSFWGVGLEYGHIHPGVWAILVLSVTRYARYWYIKTGEIWSAGKDCFAGVSDDTQRTNYRQLAPSYAIRFHDF